MPHTPFGRAALHSELSKYHSLEALPHRRERKAPTRRNNSLAALPALRSALLRCRHARQRPSAIAAAAAATPAAQVHTAVDHRLARRASACRCMAVAPAAAADAAAAEASTGGHAAAPFDSHCSDASAASGAAPPQPSAAQWPAAAVAAAEWAPAAAEAAAGPQEAAQPADAAADLSALRLDEPQRQQQPPAPGSDLPWSQSPALRFEVPDSEMQIVVEKKLQFQQWF